MARSTKVSPPEAPRLISDASWFIHHGRRNLEVLTKPAVLLVSAICVMGGFWLSQWIAHERVVNLTEKLSTKDERIALLGDQLAAYRERLQGATPDQAAKQIADLQGRVADSESKLQVLYPDRYRHLQAAEKEALLKRKDELLELGKVLQVFGGNVGDSISYAAEWTDFFLENKIPSVGVFAVPCDPIQRGILIGLKNLEAPSVAAQKFTEILRSAGFVTEYTKWAAPLLGDELDFDLFICPAKKTNSK